MTSLNPQQSTAMKPHLHERACENCGKEIPQARLQAEPAALRCVKCQELYERTHAGNGTPRV